MHKGFIESCLIILASAGWTFAQGPPSGYPAIGQQLSPGWASSDIGGSCCPRGGEDCGPRFWVGADYLLWWFKDGPLPSMLVLTGDPTTNNPGALNAGGRPILTGPGINHGAISGIRVTAGGYYPPHVAAGNMNGANIAKITWLVECVFECGAGPLDVRGPQVVHGNGAVGSCDPHPPDSVACGDGYIARGEEICSDLDLDRVGPDHVWRANQIRQGGQENLREGASHEHSPFSASAGFSEALSFVVNADLPMKRCAPYESLSAIYPSDCCRQVRE
jgi:hypothetical protein